MEQRISLVTLGVDDVARSTEFYRALGWTPSPRFSNETITFFQAGGMILALYGRAAVAEDMGAADPPRPSLGSVTIAYNARDREEVDAVLAAAEAAGARILKSARDVFWGGYSGYFADPDGHAWEVAWNPHFPILDDGSVRLPE